MRDATDHMETTAAARTAKRAERTKADGPLEERPLLLWERIITLPKGKTSPLCKAKEAAEAIASKLEGLSLKLGAKAGESGKIFGSVNSIQLADAIQGAGYDIERKQIHLADDTIKELGSYEATVKLHKEVTVTVKFDVVAE